jgi:hypothetical protein
MDDIKALLKKYYNFKPTFKEPVAPQEPKVYPVDEEPEYREDELAFTVGLGEMTSGTG